MVADGSNTGVHLAPPDARETFQRVRSGALDDADGARFDDVFLAILNDG